MSKADEQQIRKSTREEREVEAAEAVATEESAPAEENSSKAPSTAKAGKRSAKAQREADEEAGRKEKAEDSKQEQPVSKRVVHVPNPRNRHGKAYLAAREKVEKDKLYELHEAVDLLKVTSPTKFDASVELHMVLGVDPRQADQMVRSAVILPHGTGKTVRVAAVVPYEKQEEAKKAGADKVGDTELISQIEKGTLDFDILVATPDMMPKLAKAAKVLGPRGLMPSPKSGTVTPNVAGAIKEAKAGKVNYRIDRQAIVHMGVGKVSFSVQNLQENIAAGIKSVLDAKPSAAKGTYVKSVAVSSSMGPGIKLDPAKAIAAANPKK